MSDEGQSPWDESVKYWRRVYACVYACAGIPNPAGLTQLLQVATEIQKKQKAECTCGEGDFESCDFVNLDSALRACGIEENDVDATQTKEKEKDVKD